ncbi:MAG: twin-arginine translocase subunit TatC, partial [Candidatus Tectomicrobia bacterium]|nr:twin-arginine translocase subunit TatC [Candidatus Tectomicrobia bacterium]
FVLFSTLFFLLGGFFAYAIILPIAVRFFLKFGSNLMEPMISIGSYFSFALQLILALGAIFQFPLVIVFFNKIGILQVHTLTKNRKYAILIIFSIAAILSPPDVFSQLVMAVPLMGLYELSILAIRIFGKKSEKKEKAV